LLQEEVAVFLCTEQFSHWASAMPCLIQKLSLKKAWQNRNIKLKTFELSLASNKVQQSLSCYTNSDKTAIQMLCQTKLINYINVFCSVNPELAQFWESLAQFMNQSYVSTVLQMKLIAIKA